MFAISHGWYPGSSLYHTITLQSQLLHKTSWNLKDNAGDSSIAHISMFLPCSNPLAIGHELLKIYHPANSVAFSLMAIFLTILPSDCTSPRKHQNEASSFTYLSQCFNPRADHIYRPIPLLFSIFNLQYCC